MNSFNPTVPRLIRRGRLTPTLGLGPFGGGISVVVRELVAAFFGVGAALMSPVQLTALEVTGANLDAYLGMAKTLLKTGLLDERASIDDALRGKLDLDAALKGEPDFWPRPMPYVATSDGVYCGVIPLEAELVPENKYIAVIEAVQAGIRGRWNVFFTAKVRNILR